ncbi:DUF4150 domain-containing protein [Paraburkholderia agricolaris]|jgi:hypothetical protein|uniref:DUF4150 domain-containing protein n=1 Tax=Paraburkholderia agricolaris TaxID=2152888 RepID=A0ABW8ZX25_9BURK
MSDPLTVTVTGDAGDVFREQFNIQSVQQARDAVNNLDALWDTPNPWSERGRPIDRETFDEAAQSVQRRFESGKYKPEAQAQPSDHFSTGNRIASRKDGSFKAVSNTPDVCKTPMGGSTPPVPYQVVADLSSSAGVVPTVRFNGDPAYVLDQSVVPTCTGDEAGVADGVKSGTVGGEVKPTRGSGTVRAGGHPIIRDGDPCTMNNGNCTGTYVTAPAPGSSVDASGNVVGDANPPPDKGALHQVGGFFKGAGGALWDMGKGLAGLGVGALKLSPASQMAEGLSNATGLNVYHGYSETQQALGQTAQAIYNHPGAIVDGITKPYMEAWGQGNYGEAIGRGVVDVGGLFVGGVGAAGKAGEAANVAGKVGEAASATGKVGEAANVAGKAGEVADTANAAGKAGDVANTAGKAGDATEAAGQAGSTAGTGKAAAKGAEVTEETSDAAKAAGDADAKPAGDGIKVEVRNGYSYEFDGQGRVSKVKGKLKLNKSQGRNTKAQLEAGGEDRLATDQGGHFIGRRFDGPMDDFNHFAQNGNFNNGAYKSLENSWQRAIEQGKSVEVDIAPTYPGDSLRPSSITVKQWIDGIPEDPISFGNNVGGKLN